MLKGLQQSFTVSRPLGADFADPEAGRYPGEVRGAISARSSEEAENADLDRANETLIGVFSRFHTPPGGFRRGLVLTDGAGNRYRILRAVTAGSHVYLKLLQTVFETFDDGTGKELSSC